MYVYNFFELAHKDLLLGFKEDCNILMSLLYFRRKDGGHSSGDYKIGSFSSCGL